MFAFFRNTPNTDTGIGCMKFKDNPMVDHIFIELS